MELLEAGTSASDFVYKRQSLVEKAEGLVHSRSAPLEESALLQILSGNPEALGMHEPANWVEHLLGTVLYGKRSDGSFVSPVYNKEFVGETLAEGSMDIVEKLAESTGREVCTFMNPSLFKEICMQHARGVLQQIADPEVALGFVWLELHLGHALHVSGRLVDDMPIPAGPFQGASYLESLSLEYGEQCRAVPQLQRVALRIYLSCPLYGLEFIRETIGRMSAMTEKEARKLLSIAIAIGGQGAPEVAGTICRTMGAAASAEGRYSTATYWLVQAGDMPRADTLAEKMLVEMTEDLAEQRGCSGVLDMSGADAGGAPAAADARAARLQRSQELQNSAMVALQDSAAAGGRALPSALAFLWYGHTHPHRLTPTATRFPGTSLRVCLWLQRALGAEHAGGVAACSQSSDRGEPRRPAAGASGEDRGGGRARRGAADGAVRRGRWPPAAALGAALRSRDDCLNDPQPVT